MIRSHILGQNHHNDWSSIIRVVEWIIEIRLRSRVSTTFTISPIQLWWDRAKFQRQKFFVTINYVEIDNFVGLTFSSLHFPKGIETKDFSRFSSTLPVTKSITWSVLVIVLLCDYQYNITWVTKKFDGSICFSSN